VGREPAGRNVALWVLAAAKLPHWKRLSSGG
jgi:hypothetical protein